MPMFSAGEKPGREHRAFSLIELMVVMAILAALVAVGMSAVQEARVRALRLACSNNLRQIGAALHEYHDLEGSLPPGAGRLDGKDTFPLISWQTRILPFMDQQPLWDKSFQAFHAHPADLDNPPHVGVATIIRSYVCPTDDLAADIHSKNTYTAAYTSYLGVSGTNQYEQDGLLFLDSLITFNQVSDGLSNTLLAAERPPRADYAIGRWYAAGFIPKDGTTEVFMGVREFNSYRFGCPPGPYQFSFPTPEELQSLCEAFHFWSNHPMGSNFLFADTSVRFIGYDSEPVLPALATRAGNELPNEY